MRENTLHYVCCPLCRTNLTLSQQKTTNEEITSGFCVCEACGKQYKIENGIPDFLLPESLNGQDRKWMHSYDRMALSYDIIMSYVAPLFSVGLEPFERYKWMKLLQTGEKARVLDVSTGTGRNIPFVRCQIGPKGILAAMDISKGMITYAKTRIDRKKWKNVEFQRANASYLPYKENSFDAIIHVGGVNTFGDKNRALNEMVRVTKHRSKIVIVDERLPLKKQASFFGKFLIKKNPLYRSKPPTALLPRNVENLKISWGIIHSALVNTSWPFYIIKFEKT